MTLEISRMSLSDLGKVTKLSEQLGYPNQLHDIQNRFLEIESRRDAALFVAKDEKENVIGWIHVTRGTASLIGLPKAEIAALVVDENYRGQGVGTRLVKEAEEWTRGQGLSIIRVRTNVKREATHKFYQKEGYALKKTGHVFVKSTGSESV